MFTIYFKTESHAEDRDERPYKGLGNKELWNNMGQRSSGERWLIGTGTEEDPFAREGDLNQAWNTSNICQSSKTLEA